MQALWQEYEDYATLESIVVHDLDKFEMVVQAWQYEQRHRRPLDPFFKSTLGYYKTTVVRDWDLQVREQRRLFWQSTSSAE